MDYFDYNLLVQNFTNILRLVCVIFVITLITTLIDDILSEKL